jgi:hypothetical protein
MIGTVVGLVLLMAGLGAFSPKHIDCASRSTAMTGKHDHAYVP